jgi:hypothetical protein
LSGCAGQRFSALVAERREQACQILEHLGHGKPLSQIAAEHETLEESHGRQLQIPLPVGDPSQRGQDDGLAGAVAELSQYCQALRELHAGIGVTALGEGDIAEIDERPGDA